MARYFARLMGLCLAGVTVLAIASGAAAKRCTYTDSCSKKPISAFAGGWLYDSCRRAYSVSASCVLAKVRVCRFKDPCRFIKQPRTMWAPSGGVLTSACGTTWAVDSECKATAPTTCRPRRTPCNDYPITSTVGQAVDYSTEKVCEAVPHFVGPGCVYTKISHPRTCFFVDSCAKALRSGLWPGAVYVKCGKLYITLSGCKERRL